MSVYFFATTWAFAENPSELDSITNEKMVQLAIQGPGTASEEAKKERAAEVNDRTPHMMKIHAGGSHGHCMCTEELSKLHPDILFIEVSGADCSDDVRVYYIQNGVEYLKLEVEESDGKLPGGLSIRELGSTSFEKVKLAFDEIKLMGPDLFRVGRLDEMDFIDLESDDEK